MPTYFVARKSVKAYMQDPLGIAVQSITTQAEQKLYLDSHDAALIKGKRIAIIDDVISTGQSLQAVEDLVHKAGGEVVAKAAILAEGDAAKRTDIIFLEELPLFPQN
jgi:adenine phosphoribosyltransferase